jgi:hypothetical protein
MPRFHSLLVLCAALAGCHWHIDDPGTDPSPSEFDFPTGLAIDPGGRFLYVSNGNADLRFGGGTLQMIDLQRFECALDAYAEQQRQQRHPDQPAAAADPACAVFPSASDIAVQLQSDGTPIAGCIADPIDPQVVDCDEAPFALPNATVRVGNFAGTMRVRENGDPATSQRRTIYLAVRGDPSVTFVDVDLSRLAAVPDGNGHIDSPGVFDCFDDLTKLATRGGYDASTNITTVPPRCDQSHLVQTYTCPDRFGCVQGDNDIPGQPFNLLLDEGTRPDGSPISRLLVTHLAEGSVTLIDLLGTPLVADVSAPFFPADQANRHGVFGIARRDDPTRPLYYLTSNLNAAVSTFYVDDTASGDKVVAGPVFGTVGTFSNGSDGRELIFESGGQRAFMTQNAPPSVAILDTRGDQPDGRGLPANKIVDIVDVCQGPSHMKLRQQAVAGPAGAAPALKTSLYVTCFTSNQVMIVDPDRPGVDETILVGRGPTELAFNYSGEETPVADRLPTPRRRRAYLSLYSEYTIGVIDAEPGSPTENRLIARIGLPVPPPTF